MKWIAVMLVALSFSCASKSNDQAPPQTFEAPDGAIAHVVICWLKIPGEESMRQKLILTSEQFKNIPGVLSVTAGGRPVMPSTRPVVDASYDVGLVILFKDRASLKAYDTHPIHKDAVANVLKPLTTKIQIYDIEK